MNQHDTYDSPQHGPSWSHVNQWLLWLGLAAAVVWLVVKHGAHLLEVSPFLFLLACPLLHFFGHGGHGGGHGGHGGHRPDGSSERQPPAPASNADAAPADPPRGHSH